MKTIRLAGFCVVWPALLLASATAFAGEYDGTWSGYLNCGVNRWGDDPWTKNMSITIEDSTAKAYRLDLNHVSKKELRDLRGSYPDRYFLDDKILEFPIRLKAQNGKMSIKGNFEYGPNSLDFYMKGRLQGDAFVLSGTRGSRGCRVSLKKSTASQEQANPAVASAVQAMKPMANPDEGGRFTHAHLTLDLLNGWKSGPLPTNSENTIGVLTSNNISGASIVLDCYRGFMHSMATTRTRGLGTLSAALPAGQEQLSKPRQITTRKGKGTIEFWRGNIPAGNVTITLATPLAIIKTRHCWLVATGYAPESAKEQLQQEFEAIIKSAR
ncbi:MAG: hypothetical protein OEZ68_12475 [Gammaproteobacteria bacterium]|nr:hypothetical protein [Gammaproteobacteria bacterium]MDH5801611.1 hypothetical protein [Gammaproteobacteria bacterium]